MAVSTISSEINDSAGGSIANVRVVARLLPRPAFETATGITLAATLEATSDAAGQYSFVLTETTSITPSGSYYEIIEYVPDRYGGPVKHTIQVGAANTTVYASLVSAPPAPAVNTYLTQTSGDARYQQITGYGVSGDLSTIDIGDTASAGVLTTAARSDHQHTLNSGGLRSGDLVVSARSVAGSDELLCDGTAVSRTTYAALFAAISTTYGVGNGSTTFNVPDFKGRTIIGAGTGTGLTARTRGQTGGVETHPLLTAELATHTHVQNSHVHALSDAGVGTTIGTTADNGFITGSASVNAQGGLRGMTTVTAVNQNEGSGTPHQNMQPFAVANVFIKI